MKRCFAVLVSLLALPPAPQPAIAQDSESFVIIVNASNEATAISEDLVARVFLRKVRTWRGGKPALPVDQSLVSPLRLSFSRKVLGMTGGEVRDYWLKQTLSGGELAPPVRSTEQEVLEFVKAEPGAISYVAAGSSLPAEVKAVRVIP